jgi:hypothetical protein
MQAVALGEHLAKVGDVVNEVVFLDERVRPNPLEQVLFRHELAPLR